MKKKDIKLSEYKGHILLNVNDISRIYIYYGDEKVIKIVPKNVRTSDIMSLTMNVNDKAEALYKEILCAVQRAKQTNNGDEFIIIYGYSACVLSEANII